MDLTTALVAAQARERALMVELEATKLAQVEAERAKREALLREGAANREKEAVSREKEAVARETEAVTREMEGIQREAGLINRENETLRASAGRLVGTVERALGVKSERLEREAALAQYERDQRTIWLRSPECVISVLVLTAQNGYDAGGFKSLARAFRQDEQLWDAIKDRRGANGRTHLMAAARFGDAERVGWLLKRSADVNAALTATGSTALIFAAQEGHLEIARALLVRGATVNAARTIDGSTALMKASFSGHLEIARLLLSSNAHVNTAKTTDGFHSLMGASENGHLEIARLLLDRGADVNVAMVTDGMTPLLWACEKGLPELARHLLAKGAHVNTPSKCGFTPLMKASQCGHLPVVQLLLPWGANKKVSVGGHTAASLAATPEIRFALN